MMETGMRGVERRAFTYAMDRHLLLENGLGERFPDRGLNYSPGAQCGLFTLAPAAGSGNRACHGKKVQELSKTEPAPSEARLAKIEQQRNASRTAAPIKKSRSAVCRMLYGARAVRTVMSTSFKKL